MSLAANALSAKAKAMYGNRIQDDGYHELCKKQNVGEVVTYLKSQTKYSKALASINLRNVRRQQVESALSREYFAQCAKLIRYAPKKQHDFYEQEIMLIELELILDKIASIKTNNIHGFSLDIPEYLNFKTSFSLYDLIRLENYEELQSYFKKTKYKSIFIKYPTLQSVDLAKMQRECMEFYYDQYVTSIHNNFKGRLQKQLLDIIYTLVELQNITKIYRYKKFFNASTKMIEESIFTKYSRIPKAMMKELIEAENEKEVMKILENSPYQLYVDEQEFVYIEYYVEKINYHLAKRNISFSSKAPLVYLSYCVLQKVEIDNLKHIIEGIRYKKEANHIEDMLIYM